MKSWLSLGLALATGLVSANIEVLGVHYTAYDKGAAATATATRLANVVANATPTAAATATETYDVYKQIPYASMTAGGYKELQCGYGWSKAQDGSGKCVQNDWYQWNGGCYGQTVMLVDGRPLASVTWLIFLYCRINNNIQGSHCGSAQTVTVTATATETVHVTMTEVSWAQLNVERLSELTNSSSLRL